ncbi:MAG: porin, partial [Alistipes sp.]|nr:porin [Alistipes sp.]
MKTFRLLIAALSFATAASAQNYDARTTEGEYAPVVYMISVQEETVAPSCCQNQQTMLGNMSAANARQDYSETWRPGFQQVDQPTFIFASKNNRFSLALGGYINLRLGYDFDGTVNNIDFIPADIPMVRDYSDRQKLMMDATTSRLYLKAIGNTRKLGRVIVFVDADFRGGSENSYTPRIRSAYVSLLGFTLGRDVTTFCDLGAAPTTVDFQGPNAYNFRFSTLLRYEVDFFNDHMRFGVAAEMPSVSATYNEKYQPLSQRMPDFPMYLQVMWGRNRLSHFRASAVLRNMYMRNTVSDKNTSLFGWGVQASGRIGVGRALDIFFNGVYGKGITPYIQDLEGMGLDFTPNPSNPDKVQTTPMWGWQAAAQINLIPSRLTISGGYSMARVERHNGFVSENEYRQGQYIFGNIFYHVTPRFKIAGEYLYG